MPSVETQPTKTQIFMYIEFCIQGAHAVHVRILAVGVSPEQDEKNNCKKMSG